MRREISNGQSGTSAETYLYIYIYRAGELRGKKWYKFLTIFFSKLLVVILGPVSVEELNSIEDAPSALSVR